MKILSSLTLLLFLSLLSYAQIKPLVSFGELDTVLPNETGAVKYTKILQKEYTFVIYTYLRQKSEWRIASKQKVKMLGENQFSVQPGNRSKDFNFSRVYSKSDSGFYYVKDFFHTGQIKEEGFCTSVFPLIKTGVWKRYAPDGYLISKDVYSENVLMQNIRYFYDGTVDIKEVYYIADEMPTYRNMTQKDFEFAYNNKLRYPGAAAEAGIQGSILMEFVIMEDGTIQHIQITKGANKHLNQEAVRNLMQFDQEWNPGKINGKPVKVLMTLPVVFVLK